MTEEIKYYTGNCITDLHTDTSISYCNEEKCKQYIKSDGLNFCMSSVCPEKDCIYALVNKLHQTIDRLEQENKSLNFKINQLKANGLYNDLTGIELSAKVVELEQENKQMKSALEEINTLIDKLDGLECVYGDYNCDNCSSLIEENVCTYKLHKIIKDKINECLGE